MYFILGRTFWNKAKLYYQPEEIIYPTLDYDYVYISFNRYDQS